MQTTESKTTTPSLQLKTAQSPFFQQERNGDFMERSNTSFFSAGGTQQPFFTKPTLQTKLTIGQPGDKYEQEADQMADQVVQRLAENNANQSANIIQPKCATCHEEEKLQQMKEPVEGQQLQRKPIFESNAEVPELPVQTKLETTSFLQKKCDECVAEGETPGVQRAADSTGTPSSLPKLESRLSSARSGGSPLPENTRTQMERAFGSNFSGVRVHTDSSSVQMNQELGAQAFTHGSDVYFNAGKYDAGSRDGLRLLGHELTHVVQQTGANPLIQRACGSSQIGERTGCVGVAGEPDGDRFLFNVNCDSLINGEEDRLILFANTIQSNEIIEIHGFASIEGDMHYNENLSCARAIKAQNIINSELSTRGINTTIRLFFHGPVRGNRQYRRSIVIDKIANSEHTEPTEPYAQDEPVEDAARIRQVECVGRFGGCTNARSGGLPSAEEIAQYNQQCRSETGYQGLDITPTEDDCNIRTVVVDTSPIEVTAIDDVDIVGTLESATTLGEINFTDVNSMVTNILTQIGERPMSRLNIQVHGSPANVAFGNTSINVHNFATYQLVLERLRRHFTTSGFVHLRACQVGQNQPLLRLIAQAFGVPVYAGTGDQRNVLFPFNMGDYVRCDPDGTCLTPVSRP